MRLILLGPPGSGKGTQGAMLAERHGYKQISTGDLLRDAVRRGTALGQEAKRFMDAGELVPDDVILGMVREVIADSRDAFILDGFPRTIEQAKGLAEILDDLGIELDGVVVLDVPDDVVVKRISGRRSCPSCKSLFNVYFDPPKVDGVCDKCGTPLVERADDNADTVLHRLEVYRRQTEPLIAHYQDAGVRVEFVDGQQGLEAVQEQIRGALSAA